MGILIGFFGVSELLPDLTEIQYHAPLVIRRPDLDAVNLDMTPEEILAAIQKRACNLLLEMDALKQVDLASTDNMLTILNEVLRTADRLARNVCALSPDPVSKRSLAKSLNRLYAKFNTMRQRS